MSVQHATNERILQLRAQGVPAGAIAVRMGVSVELIYARLSKLGLSRARVAADKNA